MSRILNVERLLSHGNLGLRKDLLQIMDTGLSACDPYHNTKRLITRLGNRLIFSGGLFQIKGSPQPETLEFDLDEIDRVFVFAIGKGIQRVAKALEEILGNELSGGYVIAKHGDGVELQRLRVKLGGHPIPDIDGVNAAKEMVTQIQNIGLTARDLVITAVGNGVSSLCTLPAKDVPLEDVIECTRFLQIECGISTEDLNEIRNSIDQLKGGRLTRLLAPAQMVHLLAVSPNVNQSRDYDDLLKKNYWLHTLPVNSTREKAERILSLYDKDGRIPASIREHLRAQQGTPCMSVEEFGRLNCRVFALMPVQLGMLPAAMECAEKLGYRPVLLARETRCEAQAAGCLASRIAVTCQAYDQPVKPPCALFITGELLVACGQNSGVGGRNQEFVLAASAIIRNNSHIAIAAVDTDGTDGPGGFISEDAERFGCRCLCGGIADGSTFDEISLLGTDVAVALAKHNTSQPLWESGNGIWATSNISLADLCCILVS